MTCSDGSVGQTPVKFSSVVGGTVIELGDIVWGKIDPVPTALGLTAPVKRLTTGGTSQLTASAIGINPDNSATTYDVTPRSKGTTYTISNDLTGTISQDGLVTILAAFASGSSSRVVLVALLRYVIQKEDIDSASRMDFRKAISLMPLAAQRFFKLRDSPLPTANVMPPYSRL